MKGKLIKYIEDSDLIQIVSYGLKITERCSNKILLVQRRHTIEFINILKCEWTPSQLIYLLKRITPEERNKIIEIKNDNLKYFRLCIQENIQHSIEQFSEMSEILFKYIEKIEANGSLSWFFPKGRIYKRNIENGIMCSLRELKEETGINHRKINVNINNENWNKETFLSHRSIKIIIYHKKASIEYPCKLRPQLSEINDARWVSSKNLSSYLNANI